MTFTTRVLYHSKPWPTWVKITSNHYKLNYKYFYKHLSRPVYPIYFQGGISHLLSRPVYIPFTFKAGIHPIYFQGQYIPFTFKASIHPIYFQGQYIPFTFKAGKHPIYFPGRFTSHWLSRPVYPIYFQGRYIPLIKCKVVHINISHKISFTKSNNISRLSKF